MLHLGPASVCAQMKDGVSAGDVEAALKRVPFKLGGGKTELSLFEVVPSYAVQVCLLVVIPCAQCKAARAQAPRDLACCRCRSLKISSRTTLGTIEQVCHAIQLAPVLTEQFLREDRDIMTCSGVGVKV